MMPSRIPAETAPAVVVDDVWFAFTLNHTVLRGVSLTAVPGEVTMILGASGGGKTTLLKLAKGLLRPRRGAISVLQRTPSRRRLDRRVAYIPQQLGLVRNLSVLENVLTGALGRVSTVRSLLKLFPGELVQEAQSTLNLLGIGHKSKERAFSLSGGERQRVAIARAMMQRPSLILADEFLSQLDPVTSMEIMDIMRGIADRGVALVMTTHELDIVARYADHVVVLRDGEKVFDGPGSATEPNELALAMR